MNPSMRSYSACGRLLSGLLQGWLLNSCQNEEIQKNNNFGNHENIRTLINIVSLDPQFLTFVYRYDRCSSSERHMCDAAWLLCKLYHVRNTARYAVCAETPSTMSLLNSNQWNTLFHCSISLINYINGRWVFIIAFTVIKSSYIPKEGNGKSKAHHHRHACRSALYSEFCSHC